MPFCGCDCACPVCMELGCASKLGAQRSCCVSKYVCAELCCVIKISLQWTVMRFKSGALRTGTPPRGSAGSALICMACTGEGVEQLLTRPNRTRWCAASECPYHVLKGTPIEWIQLVCEFLKIGITNTKHMKKLCRPSTTTGRMVVGFDESGKRCRLLHTRCQAAE